MRPPLSPLPVRDEERVGAYPRACPAAANSEYASAPHPNLLPIVKDNGEKELACICGAALLQLGVTHASFTHTAPHSITPAPAVRTAPTTVIPAPLACTTRAE